MDESNTTFMLKLLNEFANISLEDVSRFKDEMTKKEILAQHKYSITQNKDGRFSTYLPDETKPSKRRKLVKPTLELLEKEIISFYKQIENANSLEQVTLRKFYPKWLDYKALHTESSAYIKTIDEQ